MSILLTMEDRGTGVLNDALNVFQTHNIDMTSI
jgi:hypothetical protein